LERLSEIGDLNTMSSPAPIYIDSFSIALWMYAHGYRPTGVVVNPANGKSKFIFPGEAQSAYESYNDAKDELNRLSGDGR
jgi:hypothetical protein